MPGAWDLVALHLRLHAYLSVRDASRCSLGRLSQFGDVKRMWFDHVVSGVYCTAIAVELTYPLSVISDGVSSPEARVR